MIIDFSHVIAELKPWIGGARWFRGSQAEQITALASCALPPTADDSQTIIHILDIDGLVFSVPLTYQIGAQEGAGLIGIIDGVNGDSRAVTIFDATDHPHGQSDLYALLGGTTANTSAPAFTVDNAGKNLTLRLTPARDCIQLPHPVSAHKLTSEQSNTSIIYRYDSGLPGDPVGLICKLFRVVNAGHNPDVELQQALDARGVPSVPRQYGSVIGSWPGVDYADLFVAQEFLAGSVDAWQVFTDELNTHGPVMSAPQRERITALGAMTREIHQQLAQRFGTRKISPESVVETWKERASQALRDAPQLSDTQADILAVYDDVAHIDWPLGQRIHGDYHLGQVLDVPHRGWVALDFEGEPLRPLAQRTEPDLALRDVAGMIRSFHYAAGSTAKAGADKHQCDVWAHEARTAFLDGYGVLDATAMRLLNALILDKALYEVSYEAISRPHWIDIPLAGVKTALFFSKHTD
ncbi:phosphotransferase [Arcanobacterium phocae]|uniref:phosphotransferase n=1 Tax=Arcanobacterium phocae TaxID=131112 RepID=UPI001C0ED930|nr:hypothetical protein [Arcanobacterium phocae]